MNNSPPFAPKRTRAAFAALLKAGPAAHTTVVAAVVQAVREEAACDPTHETTGDATATFNALFRGAGSFNLTDPPLFLGEKTEALHAWCLALVLTELTRLRVVTEASPSAAPWGWEALSRDAQGWCWKLLSCSLPGELSRDARRAIFEAKALVGRIVFPLLECPRLGRIPEQLANEGKALDLTE